MKSMMQMDEFGSHTRLLISAIQISGTTVDIFPGLQHVVPQFGMKKCCKLRPVACICMTPVILDERASIGIQGGGACKRVLL